MATMTEKKMTRVEALELGIEALYEIGEMEAVEVLEAIKASVSRKSVSKKDMERKALDEATRSALVSEMETGKKYSVSDMIASLPALEGLTVSKVTSLLKPLIASGVLTKNTEKGRSMYTVA